MNRKKNGQGDLFKNSNGNYYIQFKLNGKIFKRSLKTKPGKKQSRKELVQTFSMIDDLDLAREAAKTKSIINDDKKIMLEGSWDYYIKGCIWGHMSHI